MRSLSRCLAVFAAFALASSGCGKTGDRGATKATPGDPAAVAANDGWWCSEHGVPEGECGLCNQKVAAAFKAKGDWCSEHDRAESQCFICHPELKTRFAAQYEARYGKAPPEPVEAGASRDNHPSDE